MAKRKRSRGSKEGPPPPPTNQTGFVGRHLRALTLAIIVGVTFIAFSNTLFNGFAFDDKSQILENELIRSFKNVPTALVTDVWFWRMQQDKDPIKESGPTTPYYRPGFVLYLMLGWHLFGTTAAGWHFANILMHVIAVIFAFLILEKVTGDLRVTAVATLLFALHPLRSESVAWISGVTDLFLALTLLPSFYLYLRFRDERRIGLFVGSLLLYTFGAFSKEPAICLPLMIVAYEIFIGEGQSLTAKVRAAFLLAAPFVCVSAFYFVMRQRAIGFFLADPHYTSQTYDQVFLTIPLVIWKYIGLLFWPVDLSLFHATPFVHSIFSARFFLPALGLIGLFAILVPLWKIPEVRFGLLWFFVNLLPVLNLKAFSYEFLVQERYSYIPSIGFSVIISTLLFRLPFERFQKIVTTRTVVRVSVVVLLLVLSGKTLAQNSVWKDDLSLWVHGVDVAPDQSMSHFILGHRYISLNQFDLAAEQLEEYMQLNPGNILVISNLAACHLYLYQTQAATDPRAADRSHLDRAIALCEKGLAISSFGPLWDTLGTSYTFDTDFKNLDRALACYERGLKEQPDNAMLIFHAGAALSKKGDYDDAIRYLESARKVQPDLPEVYKMLGYTLQAKGQTSEAVNNLMRYLQLKPAAFDGPKVTRDIQELRTRLQQPAP
jgi:hypothetical protein